ncbi:SOS regulatory protein,LexA repressor,LexA repressor,repressor LexA,LexA DNA binding domain [[Clostridium] sordellii]|uniref:transcriptional repressor LexA n=1 Tax=Paraclostridium sordellii TaxID=1505 RepID=UPI00054410EB|nr:transcriptional repressor LexA [Paeniclostridium sordellii]CEK34322.1 SOS regulatory protein,LexA repressor,LexA repressor,repressor LexA,LexA DNA binding domain [[Clostridium] sordellii] [Paeniclostridium sordellii]
MENLNKRQIQILDLIKNKIMNQGYPPSIREIGDEIGLRSTCSVHRQLEKLENLGYIKREKTKPRAIEVIKNKKTKHQNTIKIPVVRDLRYFYETIEDIGEFIELPNNFTNDNSFLFKMNSDDLLDIGILEGDYLVVDKSNKNIQGKLVIAIADYSKVITARYFDNEKTIILTPENILKNPLVIEKNRVKVIGKITGNMRIIK